MASYAARHKAPPKHRARGRSMVAESPTASGVATARRQSQVRQDQGGSRRALVEPPGGDAPFAARPDETWRLSAPTVKGRSAEPHAERYVGEASRTGGWRTEGSRTDAPRSAAPRSVAEKLARPKLAAPKLATVKPSAPAVPESGSLFAAARSAGAPTEEIPAIDYGRATGTESTDSTDSTDSAGRTGDPRPAKKALRRNPTLAAVTAASIGVTGAVGGGALLTGDHLGSAKTLVMSDLKVSGVLAKRSHPRRSATPTATPRYTTRTVTPTPTATVSDPAEPATGEAVLDRRAVERRRAEERASRERERLALGSPKEIAAILVQQRGWSSDQFSCLEAMWERESGWNIHARNPSSGAYGIPQALPGSKMATYGSDWETNARTQIEWGLAYISSRYSTPCGAWSFWQRNNWY